MSGVPAIPVAVVLVASLIAAVTDVWKFKIHNALTVPLLISGLVYHGIVGGVAGFSWSALAVLFGFGSLIILYLMGGMGAGDVKLMAAVGAWLGMPMTFYLFIASSLAAGVYAVVLLCVGRNLGETRDNFLILYIRMTTLGRYFMADNRVEGEVSRADRRRRVIPFAAMMFVGFVSVLLWSAKASSR